MAENQNIPFPIEGVRVMASAPDGSLHIAGPFYSDESDLLKRTVQGLRDRPTHILAPDGEGLSIYKLANE